MIINVLIGIQKTMKVKRLTSLMEKNKNIIYQGIKTQRPKLVEK